MIESREKRFERVKKAVIKAGSVMAARAPLGMSYDQIQGLFRRAGTSPSEVLGGVEYVDPVAVKEKEDSAKKLAREHAGLIEQVREMRAREAFVASGKGAHSPPKILRLEKASGLRNMTAVAMLSDTHVEETVDPETVSGRNRYNLTIADARLKRFFAGVIWNVQHHRASKKISIRQLLLWLGGDLITGYIHEELLENNQLSPTETLIWLMPRIRDGILTLLQALELDSITIPCSYGNHGRTTIKTRIGTSASNSYEWLFYKMLEAEFRDDKRVRFEATGSSHQYVQVYDWMLHFHHGDSVQYKGGVGGLGVPLLKAIAPWDLVRRSDLHHVGHFHQLSDFGRVLVNGSLIGYGPYSQWIRAQYEPPQQMFYLLDEKRLKCQVTPIWCGE